MTLLVLAAVGGFAAGVITTVAGIGGGISLVALLSLVAEPRAVVGLTAPVLMIGNGTRYLMFRGELDRPAAGWLLAGAVPAAIAGALLLPRLPGRAIQVGMGLLLLTFVAVQLLRQRRDEPARSEAIAAPAGLPVGVALGGLSATVGGAGPVNAPYLHARGLRKGAFAATNAATNGTVHALKTLVFVLNGILTVGNLGAAAAAAATVTLGNRVGQVLLGRISEEAFVRLLLVAVTIAAVRLLLG
ncbi:MAG: sulfite exporter TauE/SafE family protein [Actinobacteria bacterium]|nr:sulfite exporter TauE/SafE family protein [Actinomycetota bacterium]